MRATTKEIQSGREEPLTKGTVARLLAVEPGNLSRHRDGSYTYTERFRPNEPHDETGAETASALRRAASAGCYSLILLKVSPVLGAVGGYAQKFTFALVKVDTTPTPRNRVLVCAAATAAGRSAYAAIILGTEPLLSQGLLKTRAGDSAEVAAIFDALVYVPRPVQVSVVTSGETVAGLWDAMRGVGRGRTRELLRDAEGVRLVPVSPDELKGFTLTAEADGLVTRLTEAYAACARVAEMIAAEGAISRGASAQLDEARDQFRRAGKGAA